MDPSCKCIVLRGRHSGGGGGIAEAPGSVKIIDQSVIYGRFM
jgi:hypothetical protein